MKNFICITLLMIVPYCLNAKVWIPKIFSSGMIMQRKAKVELWGKAIPNALVTIETSWGKDKYVKTDGLGNWRLKLKTSDSRESQQLKIHDSESEVNIKDILFGEVWLCGGQSNMAWKVIQPIGNHKVECECANDMIATSIEHQIRFFTVGKGASKTPLYDVNGEWKNATPQTTSECSAVAYSFAERLNTDLDVPIGIIVSAVSGSKIEAWLSKENNEKIGMLEALRDSPKLNKRPYELYNAMLYPLQGYSIKGMIYYQGESNRDNPKRYETTFPILIEQCRNNWGKKLPFYFVQIAPYDYKAGDGFRIREVQRKVNHRTPNTGIAITLDLGEENTIHPKNKRPVGNRLALLALDNSYSLGEVKGESPKVIKAIFKEDRVVVLLNEEVVLKGSSEFQLGDSNGNFYNAKVTQLNPRKIVLRSSKIIKPSIVRYSFKNWCKAEVFNMSGLPLSSFELEK
ncbi:sialate O-acetylesterase [Prolixibacteraceae bacterium]|nr:sialate O-acetylesterase [Prolixibacteraceae bacterium]